MEFLAPRRYIYIYSEGVGIYLCIGGYPRCWSFTGDCQTLLEQINIAHGGLTKILSKYNCQDYGQNGCKRHGQFSCIWCRCVQGLTGCLG